MKINEVIRPVKGGFRLYSKKGKNLGTFDTRAGAEKHEREVQAFKHMNEGYQLQLERGSDMDVLHITDTKTGKRTEVRGKKNYETAYDPNDPLHKLLDKIGKASSISDLMNGDLVGVNPRHPDGSKAQSATTVAFNENVSALASELETKYNLKNLFLSDMASRNAIELSSIIVNKEDQGKGIGSKVMQELIKYADDNGKIMVLDPGLLDKKHGTTSQSRLRNFYKQFGFIDNKGRNKNYMFRNLMIRYPQSNESLNEETGAEMLSIFQNMHHDAGNNDEMDQFILSHDWKLADFTPDMFPSEEEFFDYDDPFDRVIDIDYYHSVDLSQPIIVGPQYSDGKYSVIDGNHRAARAQQLGKTIKAYFPVKATTEGVAREPDPAGYSHTRLTAPANTIVVNTPGELDWYKMGEYIANLGDEDPHEFGQSESDMVITVANREQMIRLKKMLDRFGAEYKEIGGSHEHPEVHTETNRFK